MRIYSSQTVFHAALNRIRWLFDEFENITVGVSGGKDSTIVFELVMMVAKERGRLPLPVFFLDQEIEYSATIDVIRQIMSRPDVLPYWFQIPFKLFNATSDKERFLYCWDPAEESNWMRHREPNAIRENTFKSERFKNVISTLPTRIFGDKSFAVIAGVRTEESPVRFVSLTNAATYKWATWGMVVSKPKSQYVFYPIYDWSYTDVWAAIFKNNWPYNRVYDYQYADGVSVGDMRISSLIHETAVKNLFTLQQYEKETYSKLCNRLGGVHSAAHAGKDNFFAHELPHMFCDWAEYRDHLLKNLISPDLQPKFREKFKEYEPIAIHLGDRLYKAEVQSILANDWEFVKLGNFLRKSNQIELANQFLGKNKTSGKQKESQRVAKIIERDRNE